MIDQANRLQSHQRRKKSALSSSQASQSDGNHFDDENLEDADRGGKGGENEQGAVPDFFLDEQDVLEVKVATLDRIAAFVKDCVHQWRQ